MKRHRGGWRRATAVVAAIAILFHAALLLIHRPAAAQTVVLCTAFGLKTVSLADLPAPDGSDETPDAPGIAYCPVCLGAQLAATAVPPGEVVLPHPSFLHHVSATVRLDARVSGTSVSSPDCRGPPLPV